MSQESNGAVRQPPDRNWEVAGICAALVALVWCVFGQTGRFEFINFDDIFLSQTPEVAKGLTPGGILWAFTHTEVCCWIPLTTLSHMMDCQLYGMWAGGHHLTNVLLHSAAAVLLFLMLREMTGVVWRSAYVAALFAIHPLRVESVAWVIERKDVLSGIFFMLTLRAYTPVRTPPCFERKLHHGVVWFALGLMSKPMLVTVPFVLILLDYWPLGLWQKRSELPGLLKEKLPFFAFSMVASVGEIVAAKQAIEPTGEIPVLPRLANAAVAYVTYIGKLVHPSRWRYFILFRRRDGGPGRLSGHALS